MADDNEDDIVEEILEEEEEKEEEDDDKESSKKTVHRIVKREEKGFLSNLTKEDVILVILLLIIGIAIGYVLYKLLNRGKGEGYHPHIPVYRNMGIPSPPPEITQTEVPAPRKRHRGRRVDIESGDLILESPHTQEYWIVKRDTNGDVIDAYKTYSDPEDIL